MTTEWSRQSRHHSATICGLPLTNGFRACSLSIYWQAFQQTDWSLEACPGGWYEHGSPVFNLQYFVKSRRLMTCGAWASTVAAVWSVFPANPKQARARPTPRTCFAPRDGWWPACLADGPCNRAPSVAGRGHGAEAAQPHEVSKGIILLRPVPMQEDWLYCIHIVILLRFLCFRVELRRVLFSGAGQMEVSMYPLCRHGAEAANLGHEVRPKDWTLGQA